MVTQTDIAWAAGLFEGEGCISFVAKPDPQLPVAYLTVTSTDRDVLERFATIARCGAVRMNQYPRPNHWKPLWEWSSGKWIDVSRFLGEMLPYFLERRASKAMEILERGHLARQRDCASCGELFVANLSKALYCSRKCNNRARQRRCRDKAAAARRN